MTSTTQSSYTNTQISAWLRGLLTMAWADGNFDAQEQNLITAITQTELAPPVNLDLQEPITPDELAAALGQDTQIAENFLRTAVMVALADGLYSSTEDELLHQFCVALGQPTEVLEGLRLTLCDPETGARPLPVQPTASASLLPNRAAPRNPLQPVQKWLDQLEVHDPQVARFLCKMIPAQCPFERDVNLFGHKVVHIPPMCKLNPLYEQLVGLRFRALSYLADECKEDVSAYC